MIFEIWYYKATLPNNGGIKPRPVLVIGSDDDNSLSIVDIHYCLVSASASKGKYDVEIDDVTAKNLGLSRASIIKTTKIYTGSRGLLERKICELPLELRKEFADKYKQYQHNLVEGLEANKQI